MTATGSLATESRRNDDNELNSPSELEHHWVTADELAAIELGLSIKLSHPQQLALLS